ncbi:hypothetical protein Asppvi_005823 [Aspergillus pseudoviridinutans]|uniref:Uncharacterized protein n=1 Tax=Aspergillus pseudoviridinutans TaxID=1517512 RepID=A0A9P3BCQ5_9EURO|nr:uncharacterized protein Asppvi_005823 [Aspergillus pseudoviridinutans]GIJ86925.1 hypothetical protein Asppvi_005823 [Aspergillus pseudoviridinutans]
MDKTSKGTTDGICIIHYRQSKSLQTPCTQTKGNLWDWNQISKSARPSSKQPEKKKRNIGKIIDDYEPLLPSDSEDETPKLKEIDWTQTGLPKPIGTSRRAYHALVLERYGAWIRKTALPKMPYKANKYCNTFNTSTAIEIQANLFSHQWKPGTLSLQPCGKARLKTTIQRSIHGGYGAPSTSPSAR